MNLPSLQDIREASVGFEQALFLYQPATSERPSSQEAPVTRTWPVDPPPPQPFARAPTGASCPGVVEVEARGAVVSLAPVVSSEEGPQPAAAIATTTASVASTIMYEQRRRIGANLAGAAEGAGDRGIEHRLGQAAGEGVLLARVVAADQGPAADAGLGLMAEPRPRPRYVGAQPAQSPQRPVPGEGAEGEDGPALAEETELTLQVWKAVVALAGRRPVGRRCAAHDGGEVGVDQAQIVATPLRDRLGSQASPVQGRVEPLA